MQLHIHPTLFILQKVNQHGKSFVDYWTNTVDNQATSSHAFCSVESFRGNNILSFEDSSLPLESQCSSMSSFTRKTKKKKKKAADAYTTYVQLGTKATHYPPLHIVLECRDPQPYDLYTIRVGIDFIYNTQKFKCKTSVHNHDVRNFMKMKR